MNCSNYALVKRVKQNPPDKHWFAISDYQYTGSDHSRVWSTGSLQSCKVANHKIAFDNGIVLLLCQAVYTVFSPMWHLGGDLRGRHLWLAQENTPKAFSLLPAVFAPQKKWHTWHGSFFPIVGQLCPKDLPKRILGHGLLLFVLGNLFVETIAVHNCNIHNVNE